MDSLQIFQCTEIASFSLPMEEGDGRVARERKDFNDVLVIASRDIYLVLMQSALLIMPLDEADASRFL